MLPAARMGEIGIIHARAVGAMKFDEGSCAVLESGVDGSVNRFP